jgi:hypothetical protein
LRSSDKSASNKTPRSQTDCAALILEPLIEIDKSATLSMLYLDEKIMNSDFFAFRNNFEETSQLLTSFRQLSIVESVELTSWMEE